MSSRGRVLTREVLLSKVWGYENSVNIETRTVDMHVARLREKLRDDPDDPKVLITVRGKGYMFGAPAPEKKK